MAAAVQVRLLGGFAVSAGGSIVPSSAWRLRKAKSLVKLLSLEPAHRLHRDQALELLWPQLPAYSARNNLHQAVHAARRALAPAGVDASALLVVRDGLLGFGPDITVRTDLEDLHAAAHEAQQEHDLPALADAFRRWPGDLLPEDAYEPWLQRHLSQFRAWRTQMVLDLVDERLGRSDAELVVTLLTDVVSANPLHEPAQRALIRALDASGRRAEALVVYERLRDTLEEQLAAQPEPETRQLFQELLTRTDSEPTVQVPRPRDDSGLPARVTPLVGRRRELADAAAALARTRLLTLTGPGGAGKTTLAVELARRSADDYRDGVHLVELAALTDAQLVPSELAHRLRLELPAHGDPLDALISQLRHQQTLLVLDNCEHLLDACARTVAELLRGCPEVSLLATSREPLRITGEITWRTPSLAIPDLGRMPDPAELAHVDSVALFVSRAAAASPHFELDDDNAGAVAEICHRLDGIPLALELAAACVPALSPQQIADRLHDALSLLRRGDRTAMTRQRTLEATLEWSHQLLTAEEQVLFRRLAAFAGGFTLEAVESICSDDLAPEAVVGMLSRLSDTSLVVAESRGEYVRYRLLETVRQYADRHLKTSKDEDDVRRKHCDWYLRLARTSDPEQMTPGVDLPPASLDVEHDNLRAALSWALRNEPDTALDVAVTLSRYWTTRGFFAEGRRWLEAALAASPGQSALHVRAGAALAVLDIRRGSTVRLQEIGAGAIAFHRRQSDRSGLADAMVTDAVLAYMDGRWQQCRQRCVDAERLAEELGAVHTAATAEHVQGLLLLSRGRLTDARSRLERACARLGDVPHAGESFFPPIMLGYSVEAVDTGSPRMYFEETILLGRRVTAAQAVGYVQSNLAYLARLAEDTDEALNLLEDAISRFVDSDDREGQALALNHLGCVHRYRGEHREAGVALEHALRLRQAIGDRRGIGLTLSNLGVLATVEGRVGAGVELIGQALDGFRDTGDAPGCVATALTLASVHADADDFEAARHRLVSALRESEQTPGNHRPTAWAHAILADVHRRLGQPREAETALTGAADRFHALRADDGLRHVRLAAGAPQSPR